MDAKVMGIERYHIDQERTSGNYDVVLGIED